jgi:anti-sigma factor RsiW
MSADERHPREELDLLVDGRLTPERRSQVEAHVAGCERCRRALDAMRSAKAVLRDRLPEREVPATLSARVTAALDRVDRESGPPARAFPVARRVALGLGLAAAAALAVLLLREPRDDFLEAAAEDLAQVRAAEVPMDLETADPAALERYFAEAGLSFPARVFDFGMMGYQLVGGRVNRMEGRSSALFAYRDEDGRTIVCQMYEGQLEELPAADEERENNAIRFRIYRVGDVTLVFWQEGTVVCVLTSYGDPEEAIQLAFAKAIRVEPGG